MTENKRFIIDKRAILEKPYALRDYGELINQEETVKLLNKLNDENIQLKNKLKFLNELNEPYGVIIGENIRLKAFIKRLSNNCGEIILMNGIGYNVDKILGDLE